MVNGLYADLGIYVPWYAHFWNLPASLKTRLDCYDLFRPSSTCTSGTRWGRGLAITLRNIVALSIHIRAPRNANISDIRTVENVYVEVRLRGVACAMPTGKKLAIAHLRHLTSQSHSERSRDTTSDYVQIFALFVCHRTQFEYGY